MVKAPQITGLKAGNVSANYINLIWDNLGGFFVYRVERSLTGANIFTIVGSTSDNNFWDESGSANPLIPETAYDYRVVTTGDGFLASDPVAVNNVLTFATNLYSVLSANRINPYISFVQEKMVEDNVNDYIDFNTDEIRVALTNASYVYNPNDSTLESLNSAGSILSNQPNPKRYGLVPQVCTVSYGTHSIIINNKQSGNDTLLILEERQRVSLSSTDFGAEWVRANIVTGSVIGNPTSNGLACGGDDNTFILGYDKILSLYDGTGSKLYNDINGGKSESDTFDPSRGHRFFAYADYPAGVGDGEIQAITCDQNRIFAVANGILFKSSGADPTAAVSTWASGISITDGTDAIDADSAITKIEYFNGFIFAMVNGRFNSDGIITQYDNSALEIPYPDTDTEQGDLFSDIGLYRYNIASNTWLKMYGVSDAERSKFTLASSISRSSTDIIMSLDSGAASVISFNTVDGVDNIDVDVTDANNPVYENDNGLVSNGRSYRTIYYSTTGNVFTRATERFKFEEKHIYINGERTWTDFNRRFARLTNNEVQTQIVSNPSEDWNEGRFKFFLDEVTINDFTGSATGALIYAKGDNNLEGKLIAYYSFGSLQRSTATLVFPFNRVVIEGVLTNRSLTEDEVAVVNSSRYVHATLDPLIQKMLPEEYIKDSSLYGEFIKEYLRFISDDNDSVYGTLDRLLWNQDVNETELLEKFHGELYQRNIYASEEKRQLVNKFFTNTNNDFNSIKGTLDSYKYIFKLLYDVDIEVGLESSSKFEFFVNVTTNDFNDDLIGSTLVSANGSANITYATKKYINGVEYYEFTLNNIFGEIVNGDALTSVQVDGWNGQAISSVTGKDSPSDADSFASRLRSYYTVTVKTPIPVGIYRNTILKYVHPLGFNFLGVYLIISTVNSGLSIAHNTTEFRGLFEYRWSAGCPDVYPTLIPNLDGNGDYKYTLDQPYHRIGYESVAPNGGGVGVQKSYLVKSPTDFTAGDPYPLPSTHYITDDDETVVDYETKYDTILRGLNSDERRETKSPTFDQSNTRFFDFVDWEGSPGLTRLSISITADNVSKSCTIAPTLTQCANTFALSSTVTNSTGNVDYSWSVISGSATLSDPAASDTNVTATGNDGSSDIITVMCSITDDTSTDSSTIMLNSNYGVNSSAVSASIITDNNLTDAALDLEQFSSYRSATPTTNVQDANESDNALTSRTGKDGKYVAMPYLNADGPSVDNAGKVVIFRNNKTTGSTTAVQTLYSQTPTDGGEYGRAVDITNADSAHKIFVVDKGHAAANGFDTAIDIWTLVGSNWIRLETILTNAYITFQDGILIAFQDGYGFILASAYADEMTVFRATANDWSTYTEESLPDPVYTAAAVSYYGDYIIKLQDVDFPNNDIHLMIHRYDGTDYTNSVDLGANAGVHPAAMAINDGGTVFVSGDGLLNDDGAYVWEGDYPTYTRTLLDKSNLVSYGWNTNNQIPYGASVTRSGNLVSVGYNSRAAFGASSNGGVLIYTKDLGSWVDQAFDISNDTFGINHNLNSNELSLTQASVINSVDKTIFYGLDAINEQYSSDELVCDYISGSNCENLFRFGAEASGGNGGYLYNWSIDDPDFSIVGSATEKIITLTRTNNVNTAEVDTGQLTLRVTDDSASDLGDPLFFDEDTIEISSTHQVGINPQLTVTESTSQRCYYADGGTCSIVWNMDADPINGVGGYDITWSKNPSNDATFTYDTTTGTDVVFTAVKPVGISPISESIGVVVNVEDQGSDSTGQDAITLNALFLQIVGGSIQASTDNTQSCNYASGSCTNTWALTALPTGGFDQNYTFAWEKVSGDSGVTIVGGTGTATISVEATNANDTDETLSAVFKCVITDGQDSTNTGDTSTYTVTSTHTTSASTQANLSSLPTNLFQDGAWFENSGTDASCYIKFDATGGWEFITAYNGGAGNVESSGTYASDTVLSTDYEIFVTQSTTDYSFPTQADIGSWVALNTDRIYGMFIDERGVFDKDYSVQIRKISTPSNTDSKSFNTEIELT
jgi:hypothetical protein